MAVHHGDGAVHSEALGAVHIEDKAVSEVLAERIVMGDCSGRCVVAQGYAISADTQYLSGVAIGDAQFAIVGCPDQPISGPDFNLARNG